MSLESKLTQATTHALPWARRRTRLRFPAAFATGSTRQRRNLYGQHGLDEFARRQAPARYIEKCPCFLSAGKRPRRQPSQIARRPQCEMGPTKDHWKRSRGGEWSAAPPIPTDGTHRDHVAEKLFLRKLPDQPRCGQHCPGDRGAAALYGACKLFQQTLPPDAACLFRTRRLHDAPRPAFHRVP